MAIWQGKRSLEVLTLTLQGEKFALEAGRVQEILDLVNVTEVPGGPAFLNGLVNVRGKGIVLNEPSWVAIDKRTKRPLAIGAEAR